MENLISVLREITKDQIDKINDLNYLGTLIKSILVLFILYFARLANNIIFKIWSNNFKNKYKSKTIDSLGPLFKKAITVSLVITAFIWILYIWGFNIVPLLAGVGVFGLVIGFAMQDTLKNIFGGISLILDKTIRVGDRIALDGKALGIVDSISIRSTKIITFNNDLLTIANGKLSEMNIGNFNQPSSKSRVVINFNTAYGIDIEEVKNYIYKKIKENIKDISKDHEIEIIMTEMLLNNLNWELRFWVDDYAQVFDKKIEATALIYTTLKENKIDAAFSNTNIYIKKDESSN